jgi:DNA-binding NarL/FixJ family response regulator
MSLLLTVAIVEDDAKVRESLVLLLNESPGFSCIGAFPNAESALKEIPRKMPDLVLMDVNLPKMSGIQCVAALRQQWPKLQFLMLTSYEDSELVFESLKAGASGYLLKLSAPAEILAALREVHKGGSPMSSSIARTVVEFFRQTPEPALDSVKLTPREKEILEELSKGLRYKEIADNLGIGHGTINTYIRSIYEKLQVHSRTEAVMKYFGKS